MRYILQTLAGYILALMVACLCLGVTGSCAAVQKAGQIATDVIVDCALPAVEHEVVDLLDEAGKVLQGGAPDWPRQLDNLGSNGVWAAYCAVQVVLQDLTPPAPTSQPARPTEPAAVRAQAYLAAKHVQVVHVGTGEHYRAMRAGKGR